MQRDQSSPDISGTHPTHDAVDNRPGDDERYAHDGLDRLALTERGTHRPGSSPDWTYPTGNPNIGSQKWGYDQIGNWYENATDTNKDGSFASGETDERMHNHANELIEIDDGGFPVLSLLYDDAGNLTSRFVRVGTADVEWRYAYDAWNRLVGIAVVPDTTPAPRAEFGYNALHERVLRLADADLDGVDLEERTRFYYDASWRIIEEHTDVYEDSVWEPVGVLQRVWGLMYLDEMLAYHRDDRTEDDPEETPDDGYFALHDRLGSIVILCNSADGDVAEYLDYTSYGIPTPRVPFGGDVNEDGEVDLDDFIIYAGACVASGCSAATAT